MIDIIVYQVCLSRTSEYVSPDFTYVAKSFQHGKPIGVVAYASDAQQAFDKLDRLIKAETERHIEYKADVAAFENEMGSEPKPNPKAAALAKARAAKAAKRKAKK